jgi:hypothetical protein
MGRVAIPQRSSLEFRTIQVCPKDRLTCHLAGSTCGKPAAHRDPLAGMIDGGTAREGKSCVWPETA